VRYRGIRAKSCYFPDVYLNLDLEVFRLKHVFVAKGRLWK
jgi:hypothetical protein